MSNNKLHIRKKKTFRHSTTFYRRLAQRLAATKSETIKHYYPVVNTPNTKSKQLLDPLEQVNNETYISTNKSIDLNKSALTYQKENGNFFYYDEGDYIDNDWFLPAEDRMEVCDEEERILSQISLTDQLRTLYYVHKPTHTLLNDVLHILKSQGHTLPSDSRTLLKTPKSVNIISMGNGQFWYNGIRNCLLTTFSATVDSELVVSLVFNVDGLPPFRGSSIEFWPILFKIENFPQLQPMVVALYCGETKPPLQDFLTPFVDELNDILQSGIKVNNRCNIQVMIKYFVCDTLARNFIKRTVGFNAAHGCIKCTVVGEFDKKGRHMSFPRIDCPLRTDESFRMKTDDGHYKEDSPLLKLPINMVEDIIVADALHLFD